MAQHAPIFRSLSLLKRLQLGPANSDELVAFVHRDYDSMAYEDFGEKTGHKRFENNIARLRGWGVEIDYRDAAYHLLTYRAKFISILTIHIYLRPPNCGE